MMTIKTLVGAAVVLLLCLQKTADASPQWRPLRPMRRRNGGSPPTGCWTPRGIMELGQRIYPSGCSRIVCKMISGEPIIEHQFCKASTSEIPENCILSNREWLRYPDCCPELHCSPAPTVMDDVENAFLRNGQKSQAYDAEGSTSIILGKFEGPVVTPPPKLYMTTEIVYGVGFSKPFQPTTRTPYVENDSRTQHSDLLDSPLTQYYDSPGNTLNGWDDGKWQEEFVTEIPYQYKEDFYDSTTTDPVKVTPYVITYPTTSDFTYLLKANNSSSPLYHFFNQAEHVHTSPLPYRQNGNEEKPTTPRPVTYPNPQPVRPALLPDETYQSAEVNTPSYLAKDTETTTQKPYVKPTTYSPPADLWDRFKSTTPGWRRPTQYTHTGLSTHAMKVTTPSIEWAAKTTKNSLKSTTKGIKNPTHYLTKVSSSPKYDIYTTAFVKNTDTTKRPNLYKTTERPSQRVTKRERLSTQVKKQAAQRIPSVSTATPGKTTPVSYEFATPKLNPNNHDLVEFIHSTLDPSALIPGHDDYMKSKYDSKKEYLSKAESDDDQHRKRKRSLSYEVSTEPYNMDTEAPIDHTERRGRPMFYIPWRDDAENNIVTELTTSIDLTSTKSHPLTKFEQASYILQALVTTSKPSFNVVNTQINETTDSDTEMRLNNFEVLESANFSKAQNLSGSNMQLETTAGVKGKKITTTGQQIKNETRTEQREEKHEAVVSEQINRNTSNTGNFSAETTESSPQISETTTKNPYITHATVSSTTTFPETNFKNNDTLESTTEISIAKADTIVEQGEPSAAESMPTQAVTTEISIVKEDKVMLQEESSAAESLKTHAVTATSANTTSNNRGRRLPNSRRKSQRRHRGQQITPSKIRGNRQNQENQTEQASQKTEPQLEEEIMSRSAPQQKQSWNLRPNSETSRTRAHVPVLNYERKYERNNSEILQLEPKASTVTLHNSSSNEYMATELDNKKNVYSGKGDYAAEAVPGPVYIAHFRKENNMGREDTQQKEKVPHTSENTSDHIRKQSSSQFVMHEMRSKYHPGKQTETHVRSTPSSYDRSEFSTVMGSTQAIKHVEDSYRESEVYSSSLGNSQGSAKNFHHPQMYKPFTQTKPESNPNVPVPASSIREASRSYFHDGQRGHSNTYPESASKQSSSVSNVKPPFNKWFTDIFGDNLPPKDWASNPNFRPHVPREEYEDLHSSRPGSKFTVSQNQAQNTRTYFPPEDMRHSRNYSSGIANSPKSFTVPQRPPVLFKNGYKREGLPEQPETPWTTLEKQFAASSPKNTALHAYSSNGSAQNSYLGKPSSVQLPFSSANNSARLSSIYNTQTRDRNVTVTPETKLQNTYTEATTNISNSGHESNITREVPRIYEARNPARYRPSTTNKPVSKNDSDKAPLGIDSQISENEDSINGTQMIKTSLILGRNNRRRTPGTIQRNGSRNRTPTTAASYDNARTSSTPPKYLEDNRHMTDFDTPAITRANNSQRQPGFTQNRFSFHQQDSEATSVRPARVRGRPKTTSLSSVNTVPSPTVSTNVNHQHSQPLLQPSIRTNTRQRAPSLTEDAVHNPSRSQSAPKSASFSPWETVTYKAAPRSNTNPVTTSPPSLPVPEDPALLHLSFWEPQRKDS